jgi:hypothetical protein
MSRRTRIDRTRSIWFTPIIVLALARVPTLALAQEPEPKPALAPEDDLLGAMFERAVAHARWTVAHRDAVTDPDHRLRVPGPQPDEADPKRDHAIALFEFGWSLLEPSGAVSPRYDESLDAFVAAILAANEGWPGSETVAPELRRKARRALVRAYAHVGTAADAGALFEKVGNGPTAREHDARRILELLAFEYFATGQYAESTRAYVELQSRYPEDTMVCQWQAKVAINSLATDDKESQFQATDELLEIKRQFESDVYPKSVRHRCWADVHAIFWNMTNTWHAEAEQTDDLEHYEFARRAYERHLPERLSGKDGYPLQYGYARLLHSIGVHLADSRIRGERERGRKLVCAASREFTRVCELDPEGVFTRDAAWQQLAMTKQCLGDDTGDEATAELISAYEFYLKYVKNPAVQISHDHFNEPELVLALAESFAARAKHEQAARNYEAFATQFTSDERAPDVLENAFLLRLGLGQRDRARADVDTFEQLYAGKDTPRAARLFWTQRAAIEKTEALRQHAVAYLESYGRKGGVDRAVVAEVVIAEIDWRRSCAEPLLHDACVTIQRKPGIGSAQALERHRQRMAYREFAQVQRPQKPYQAPKRCGPATSGVMLVHARDEQLSAAAQARFARALRLAREAKPPADDPNRLADFDAARGMAMVYAADQDYEEYLRLDLPEELDFWVEEWRRDSGIARWEQRYRAQVETANASQARLEKFVEAKTRLADDLRARYAEVEQTRSPKAILAAAARTAALDHDFADQLVRARVPQTFASPDQTQAYCELLWDRAAPIRDRAIAAYEVCLARAYQLEYTDEFSRACEEELQQLDPSAPATHELFGEPIVTTSRVESIGVVGSPSL